MCGFVGYVDLRSERRAEMDVLIRMATAITHRGPDSSGYFIDGNCGLGLRRLSILDLQNGDQPLYNEDRSIVLVCNGEIYNYAELRDTLIQKGHIFVTNTDVEVLIHLYEEEGTSFPNKLNGQFAFALYDKNKKMLFLARDHFGITPLYYTVADGVFIFASEIKALLEHPFVNREVDLQGLDQILSLPGLVSPTTMFKDIKSLKSGHSITVEQSEIKFDEYWDLDYPRVGEISYDKPPDYYQDQLSDLLTKSVKYRLQADVPVGFYLSGGLDSSLIAALIKRVSPSASRHSFSIGFTDQEICEFKYQRMMAGHVDSQHHEIVIGVPDIYERFAGMIYQCECPVKETYNTCSMALSEAARKNGVKVVLTGEGADELFAGYVGYRFDKYGIRNEGRYGLETVLEEELRERLWGDKDLFYETDHHAFREIKAALYSSQVNDSFEEFAFINSDLVNKERIQGRHPIHQRSYLDFKLRLSDHLLSDHGDKMALANSVEARYPFLDKNLVEFATEVPPDLKLRGFTEKYILKKIAEDYVPREIIAREKFGFRAPSSPELLKHDSSEWIGDVLSYENVKKQGYFNPEVVERLKTQYSKDGFKLNFPFENDLLIVVLSFGLFLKLFSMPSLG